MIQRRNPNRVPNLKLGSTVKKLAVETLQSAEEVAGTVTDTLVTLRSGVELVYNAIDEANIESRTDVALAIQSGLDRLMSAGMSETEARKYLQCEEVTVAVTPPKVHTSKQSSFLTVDQNRMKPDPQTTTSGE